MQDLPALHSPQKGSQLEKQALVQLSIFIAQHNPAWGLEFPRQMTLFRVLDLQLVIASFLPLASDVWALMNCSLALA